MDKNVIVLDQVTKTFGDHTVLENLTFNIPKDKITTILGFSGAGKSTLLKHMLGLIRPTTGTVTVLGQQVDQLSDLKLRKFRRHFGMLFQYAALFDSLSAFENIAFPLREFTDFGEDEIRDKVYELLESVDIKDHSYYKIPSELSGGMRKRVGLARAMALSPEIMLYDEPTTGLDPVTTKRVNDLILQMAKRGDLTSVIISHDVKATLVISDYIAFLHMGKIVEFLPASEFAKSTNPLVQRFINL